jgi:hypothetical protein
MTEPANATDCSCRKMLKNLPKQGTIIKLDGNRPSNTRAFPCLLIPNQDLQRRTKEPNIRILQMHETSPTHKGEESHS